MDLIPALFLIIIIPSFSLGLAPDSEYADNPEFYEAMKIENVVKVFGPDVTANAPIYDEDLGNIIPDLILMSRTSPIQFYLVSSSNPKKERPIHIYDLNETMSEAEFNKRAPTKIICHGFNSNYKEGPGRLLRKAYYKAYKHVNIILIDWSPMAGLFRAAPNKNKETDRFYFTSATNTEIVGNQTRALISFLVNKTGVSMSNIHLIGHSLGAHAMGHAGLAVQHDLKEKVGRITGLDPAGPCYEKLADLCFLGTYRAIRKTDAEFVDAIHTHTRFLGITRAVGHADFYPNGGTDQEGCSAAIWDICSHDRAIEQMADSVEFGRIGPGRRYLEGKHCASWTDYNKGHCNSAATSELGEFCPVRSNGTYYLKMKPLSALERGILQSMAGMTAFMPRAGMSKLPATP